MNNNPVSRIRPTLGKKTTLYARKKSMPDSEFIQILEPGIDLKEWETFVSASPQGSLFCHAWWLDAVCPGNYKLVMLKHGDKVLAAMPIFQSKRLCFRAIHMPPLTQTLGLMFSPFDGGTYEKQLSFEMNTCRALIKGLPAFDVFNVHFHPNFKNWLPFYWAGFRQTTLYSYVLDDLSNLDAIFSGFDHSKRKNIKKAEAVVSVREDLGADEFYANHRLTLKKQGQEIAYTSDLFCRIYRAAYANDAGKSWYAVDNQNNLHAAIFVVFDSRSAYYLVSTIDPDFRNSGAATLLVKHAITQLSKRTLRFDFEGSMIEGVETSFRRFGAKQVPYFSITKSSKSVSIFRGGQQLLKSLFSTGQG